MTSDTHTIDPRLTNLDGFRVEIDWERERADVILARPPPAPKATRPPDTPQRISARALPHDE